MVQPVGGEAAWPWRCPNTRHRGDHGRQHHLDGLGAEVGQHGIDRVPGAVASDQGRDLLGREAALARPLAAPVRPSSGRGGAAPPPAGALVGAAKKVLSASTTPASASRAAVGARRKRCRQRKLVVRCTLEWAAALVRLSGRERLAVAQPCLLPQPRQRGAVSALKVLRQVGSHSGAARSRGPALQTAGAAVRAARGGGERLLQQLLPPRARPRPTPRPARAPPAARRRAARPAAAAPRNPPRALPTPPPLPLTGAESLPSTTASAKLYLSWSTRSVAEGEGTRNVASLRGTRRQPPARAATRRRAPLSSKPAGASASSSSRAGRGREAEGGRRHRPVESSHPPCHRLDLAVGVAAREALADPPALQEGVVDATWWRIGGVIGRASGSRRSCHDTRPRSSSRTQTGTRHTHRTQHAAARSAALCQGGP